MRFSQSTHLLMLLSLETLTFIITSLPVLVELIDLVNYNFSISNDLTQMVNFPTWIPGYDSHRFISIFWCYNDFHSIQKFWSCCCLSFHWLSIKFITECPISSHRLMTILVLNGTMIIWEMFHGRISLNLVLLLLLVNFVSRFKLELMYISLIENISSSLTHLHGL